MVFNIEEHEDINFREQNLLAFDSFLKVTKATGYNKYKKNKFSAKNSHLLHGVASR